MSLIDGIYWQNVYDADKPKEKIPETNYQRIMRKTPEELAEYLEKVGGCGPYFDKEYCNNKNGCPEGSNCWLDWLRQEDTDGAAQA